MKLTLEEWGVVLTVAAAWGGLALGLWNALYNWWQRRERRRVEASLGLIPHPMLAESIRGIIVKFINERGSVVVIEEVGFECPDGRKAVVFQPSGDRLPTTVLAGHAATYFYALETWRRAIQKGDPIPVRAYCRDATDRRYETPLSQTIRSALLE